MDLLVARGEARSFYRSAPDSPTDPVTDSVTDPVTDSVTDPAPGSVATNGPTGPRPLELNYVIGDEIRLYMKAGEVERMEVDNPTGVYLQPRRQVDPTTAPPEPGDATPGSPDTIPGSPGADDAPPAGGNAPPDGDGGTS
jgi:hypothetical protein